MAQTRHIVKRVLEDSIAEALEIEPGDEILKINDQEMEDIFDYQFLLADEYIEVLIRKKDSGEEWVLEVEKDSDEDLGIEFESSLMDDYRSCRNRCVFCFIDQMPKGMRDTLYFKDDDSRLSFLQGNYVTLTNMSDHDIDRIIHYRMEPINISFQTTNPELRVQMLRNRHAGEIFGKVKRLADAGIELNGQIVLCRGLNDGEELDRSIRDLTQYLPALRSVSVVPVGLSRFRDGLYPLEPFTAEDAAATIDLIENWQKKIYDKEGIHFIHASDEWYLLAEREVPEEERYDGYLQLENGVGMLRLLDTEVSEALAEKEGDGRQRKLSLATGRLPAAYMRRQMEKVTEKFPGVQVSVYPITNDFFGEMITVSGLITGQDLIAQLKDKDLGECLLIPCNMLRSGESVFLDDVTVEQVVKELQTPVLVVDPEGRDLVEAVLDREHKEVHRRRQIYEQTDRCDCGQTECR
ncbi:MAG: DUF512 domain-containing protein [Eubacteriales bacterium]|nr:DUF512 domain-containing protein [Eubacteriales bacterium]